MVVGKIIDANLMKLSNHSFCCGIWQQNSSERGKGERGGRTSTEQHRCFESSWKFANDTTTVNSTRL